MRIALATIAVLALGAGTAEGASPSSSLVKRLNAYLAGTPMAGTGEILVNQGRKHDVSPYFIVAVAAKESSHGHRACSDNPRNVWGLGACGRVWSPPYFANWTQAVNYFVRFVRSRWPSATNPWHFRGYCSECEASWAEDVSWFMERMGSSTNVRFGLTTR